MTGDLPASVGVHGGGRMGAGIAHAFLVKGSTVVVVERDDVAAAAARERVTTTLAQAQDRGTLDDATAALRRLTVTSRPADLADCALVVEAVLEDAALKAEVLAAVERLAPRAALATNTSSLSVDRLASSLADPTNLIGLHFFNPVPASDLVEIVVGAERRRPS